MLFSLCLVSLPLTYSVPFILSHLPLCLSESIPVSVLHTGWQQNKKYRAWERKRATECMVKTVKLDLILCPFLHIFCVFISKCQISLSLTHIIKIKFAQTNEACSFCYLHTNNTTKSPSYTAAFPLALFNSAGTWQYVSHKWEIGGNPFVFETLLHK